MTNIRQRAADDSGIDAALRALADGNRRRILAHVQDGALAVGELAERVDLTQQAVSHHLRVLRTAGLVSERREGTRHLFALRTDGFEAVQQYLDDFWPSRLATLKSVIEGRAAEQGGGAVDA